MIIIRPIKEKDTEAFVKMAFEAGIGMTSMPKNREILEKRVQESVQSFADAAFAFESGCYLFVLEDLKNKIIGGTCGIIPKTGRHSPLPFYHVKHLEQHKRIGSSIKTVPTLHVVHHKNYWTEICSLYLTKDYRHSGLGRLLSLSRFLFIAAFPERFDTKIFAEMRGHVNASKVSTFWEGIGQHFVDTDFETLMHLRDEGVMDLKEALPLHPIYIELLPKNVQDSLGKIHEETQAALQMLTQEGFQLSNEFDVCDGGPKIEATTTKIRSVEASVVGEVGEMTRETLNTSPLLLSNNKIAFKACLSPIKKHSSEAIIVPIDVAEALDLNIGDKIRYVSPYKEIPK